MEERSIARVQGQVAATCYHDKERIGQQCPVSSNRAVMAGLPQNPTMRPAKSTQGERRPKVKDVPTVWGKSSSDPIGIDMMWRAQ